MKEFEYKVSVIVPVYNVENYLENCLDSLCNQTIEKKDMEVLLINDGSTDDSLRICKKYAGIYPCFKVFDKDNEGVSKTRNFGIRLAQGKYIMYLDSDDVITENTIESVVNFFEKHYEETDVVTYPERAYFQDGRMRTPHIRYQILKKSKVYDINEKPFIFQNRLNIATKNKKEENIFFDETLGYHEDQKYCSELLKSKKVLERISTIEKFVSSL